MFRVCWLLFACTLLTGCAVSPEQREALRVKMAELEEKKNAELAAVRIPEVQLTPQQRETINKNRGPLNAHSEIVWLRAGRQNDGKIFACAVISNRSVLGEKNIGLAAGTFEADGSFASTTMLGLKDSIAECRDRGFDPPVRRTTRVIMVR